MPAYSAKRWRTLPNSSLPHRSRRRRFITSCPGGPLLSPPNRRLQPLLLPSCCLHLRSSLAAAFTTTAAWSWPQESAAACFRPCQAREALGQAASLRQATRSLWIQLFSRWRPHHSFPRRRAGWRIFCFLFLRVPRGRGWQCMRPRLHTTIPLSLRQWAAGSGLRT